MWYQMVILVFCHAHLTVIRWCKLLCCVRMMSPVPCALSTMMLWLLKLMKHTESYEACCCTGNTRFGSVNENFTVFRRVGFENLQLRMLQCKKVKVARTELPSIGLRSWSQIFAVSQQVTWVINPAIDRLLLLSARSAVTPETVRRAASNFAAWWKRHDGCEQFA